MNQLTSIPDLCCSILMWIHNFLCDRKQRVVVNSCNSDELSVTSRVPQGSVLGPIWFLIYINNLPRQVDCCISLFADDTLIYQTVNCSAEKQRFQNNIDAFEKWSNTWKMLFNVSKCSVMVFNQEKRCFSGWLYSSQYSVGKIVDETKYLGVILQSKIKFDEHIRSKTRRARQHLGIIKYVLYDALEKAKLLAYTTLCRPHVEYASTVWDPFTKQLQHELDMVQNVRVRVSKRCVIEALKELAIQTPGDRCTTSRQLSAVHL